MFATEMHLSTFVILVFQTLVLFAQLLFYLSRPKDSSRLRFLILIITYIFYNFFSGIYPDEQFTLNVFLQNIIAYLVGIIVVVYFIYYIYKEFDIYPFKYFDVRTLFFVLITAFVLLFIVPYYISGNLSLSRKIFISIPLMISFVFVYQIGNELIRIYKNPSASKSKYYKYRVVSGYLGLFTLSLMPVIVAFGDYQSIEQPVVNFGFIIMMTVYIFDFVYQAKQEASILAEIREKKSTTSNNNKFEIPQDIVAGILNNLKQFEDKEGYLKVKTTTISLAKKFNTNSKYLSNVVNLYKEKTFTEYINELKINYIIERLNRDKKFLNYTQRAIAKEVGFNTTEALSQAFYKKEKIKFSDYLKKIRGE
ncbi:helix-turn-helix domain-containing protein [Aquimarina sp. I32.4]|uniref:helix-turn-helix domain-containing protein n=1 Tax=Aquimarina sp. I32.4 TaxID=2053903 RepID=UPI0011AED1A7|nr:helix-turn-helix domain-containing protein [Aquimarina sp. I32.4]